MDVGVMLSVKLKRSHELYDSCSNYAADDGVHTRAVPTRGEHGDLHLSAICSGGEK